MFFSRRKDDKLKKITLGSRLKENELVDGDEDADILEIIELVAKSTALEVKDLKFLLEKVVDTIPTTKELKAEIVALKAELKYQQDFNRELIHKLIDKPAPASATATYLAQKAEREAAEKKNGGFAAVDNKAATRK